MGKGVVNVSVIGGADGPTSIFLVGKMGKGSLSQRFGRYLYRKKKNRVAKKMIADPHTLEEVIVYIRENYHAVEVPQQSHNYREQRDCLRESMIMRHQPELLGELAKIEPPDRHDETSLKEFWRQLELRSEKARSVEEEAFSLDFHLYEISVSGKGKIEVMIEYKWEQFGVSYSGDKKLRKQMKRIYRDICLYYGVSEEDIKVRSERYSSLVSALSS